MRVIEPQQFRSFRPAKKTSLTKRGLSILLVFILLAGVGYGVWAAVRPLPLTSAQVSIPETPGEKVRLSWPSKGQAVIGAEGYGVLDTTRIQSTAPIASVAKVVTALAVLKQKPLAPGEQGPMLTLDKTDVAMYQKEVARQGSTTVIKNGEKISQYDALEALLLPSANNMAGSLARWAFGSEQAYLEHAEAMTDALDMDQTHIADASGFSPKTTSTPEDLVKLGQAALNEPVIKEIVAKRSANVPVAGKVMNVNHLAGKGGNIGIKTGNTDQAGGCFLFATKRQVKGRSVTVIGAVMGLPHLADALASSLPLIDSAYKGFGERTLLDKGEVVGTYSAPWGQQNTIVAAEDLKVFGWRNEALQPKASTQQISANTSQDAGVGTVSAGGTQVGLNISSPLTPPPLMWRLKRGFN